MAKIWSPVVADHPAARSEVRGPKSAIDQRVVVRASALGA